jgi:hypothetical protein
MLIKNRFIYLKTFRWGFYFVLGNQRKLKYWLRLWVGC